MSIQKGLDSSVDSIYCIAVGDATGAREGEMHATQGWVMWSEGAQHRRKSGRPCASIGYEEVAE